MLIKWLPTKNNIVSLSENSKNLYQINSEKITIHFGTWMEEMEVSVDKFLPDNYIGLPENLPIPFQIPDELSYDIKVESDHLFLGPVIGFLPFNSSGKLNPNRLKAYEKRLANYDTIGGLIFICTNKSIDMETKLIEGYYYNPNRKPPSSQWIPGKFPFPNALYTRRKLKPQKYGLLVESMGNRIFNTPFNKWEFWKFVSANDEVKNYVPYTEEYTGYKQVIQFIEKFDSIYLKPRAGSQGRGIIMVKKSKDGYMFKSHKNKVKYIKHWFAVSVYLKKKKLTNYIIQQGVPTKYKDKHVDFRIYIQKDETQQWQVQGLIGRIAKKGRIITNLKYTTETLSGHETIKRMFHLDDEDATDFIGIINKACIRVCEVVDQSGNNIGDVAIDLIVDDNLNIWILEMNKAYQYKSLKKKEFNHILKKVMPTPFSYAKALGGF